MKDGAVVLIGVDRGEAGRDNGPCRYLRVRLRRVPAGLAFGFSRSAKKSRENTHSG